MCLRMRDMVNSKLGGEMKRGVFSFSHECGSIPHPHVRDKEKKHLSPRYVPAWSAAVSSCEIYLFFA